MAVQFNHTIIPARDKWAAANFLADMFDLAPPKAAGFFVCVELDNGVSLDFAELPPGGEIFNVHLAFLVSEEEFDGVFARIKDLRLDFWGDPRQTTPGEINHNDGGRGVYFLDPDGHYLEAITKPYGSQ
jgi:catechol 2,3-dioxygenase-like lactoylglutathione lyase family enzyme